MNPRWCNVKRTLLRRKQLSRPPETLSDQNWRHEVWQLWIFLTCFKRRRSLMLRAARGKRVNGAPAAWSILRISALIHWPPRAHSIGADPQVYMCGEWFWMSTIFPAPLSRIHHLGLYVFGSLWTHHSSNADTCRWSLASTSSDQIAWLEGTSLDSCWTLVPSSSLTTCRPAGPSSP